MGKDRNPRTLTETKRLYSPLEADLPEEEKTYFVIKKADNRADVERSNLFAKVEYVAEDEGIVTRRDFPMGDLQVRTILLCLAEWNIEDGGRRVPINQQTVLDYLLPEERIFLYNEILEFNPIWGSGREATKSDAD